MYDQVLILLTREGAAMSAKELSIGLGVSESLSRYHLNRLSKAEKLLRHWDGKKYWYYPRGGKGFENHQAKSDD